jgi:hypothetical protein
VDEYTLEHCLRYIRLVSPMLATATLLWCLFVGWWIWITPVRYVGLVSDPEDPDKSVQAEKYERFGSVSGLGATPLVIPVLLSGVATLAAWMKRPLMLFSLGLVLLVYGFVTGFSIGSAYMPAGGVLLLAALLAFASRPRR